MEYIYPDSREWKPAAQEARGMEGRKGTPTMKRWRYVGRKLER
jgi:hypothetical protein